MPVRIALFGGFEAISDFGRPVYIRTRKAVALLAYLALNPQRAITRSRLATLLWEDSPDGQARASLRQALATLRQPVWANREILEADRERIGLVAGAVTTDVAEFEALLENTWGPDRLTHAVSLYRGDLLDGLHTISSSFDGWLGSERQRLRDRAVAAMVALLGIIDSREAIERRIALARRILAIDPLQEAVHRALMGLYLRQGRRSEAIRQYFRCRAVLKREIAARPEWETERLYLEIARAHPDRPPPDV